jgi:hypothetical protein
LIVGNAGTILFTFNGYPGYISLTSGTTNNLNAIAYQNGRFIVVGNASTILTSLTNNLNTWTTAASGLSSTANNLQTVITQSQ